MPNYEGYISMEAVRIVEDANERAAQESGGITGEQILLGQIVRMLHDIAESADNIERGLERRG